VSFPTSLPTRPRAGPTGLSSPGGAADPLMRSPLPRSAPDGAGVALGRDAAGTARRALEVAALVAAGAAVGPLSVDARMPIKVAWTWAIVGRRVGSATSIESTRSASAGITAARGTCRVSPLRTATAGSW
jgi:hypothetical protein